MELTNCVARPVGNYGLLARRATIALTAGRLVLSDQWSQLGRLSSDHPVITGFRMRRSVINSRHRLLCRSPFL
jgi:hypothetical protein